MAKNRQPEKTVESSEEDDDASSQEVASHDSDSEPEQTQGAKKPATSTPTTTLKKTPPQSSSKSQKQLPAASSSSSDEESGSESDSDSDGPDPQVKPIATKPMDGAHKSNLAAGKRPAEEKETEAKDTKKAKKKASEPESSAKQSTNDSKKLFQRLWSEDDEIAILEGMTDYALSKNADPLADLNAFHDFIRKNLHVDVTKVQLQDKIRRLKRKYMNNKGKEKGGKVRTLSNPHEQKAYELSKNIWGNENVKEIGDEKMVTSPRANGRAVKKTPAKGANAPETETETETEEVNDTKRAVVAVNADAQSSSPAARLFSNGGSLEDNILRTGEEMFALGKWVEKGKEWNKLKMEEIAIIQQHLELKSAQVKLVLDAMKSDDH